MTTPAQDEERDRLAWSPDELEATASDDADAEADYEPEVVTLEDEE